VPDYWEDGYTLDVTYRGQPAPILSWHCETNREAQEKTEDALFEAWEILLGKRPDQDGRTRRSVLAVGLEPEVHTGDHRRKIR
jgi:hypothetical protein